MCEIFFQIYCFGKVFVIISVLHLMNLSSLFHTVDDMHPKLCIESDDMDDIFSESLRRSMRKASKNKGNGYLR